MSTDKTYIAIDLKSFYASVECTDRGLDALTTNLVVADKSRTSKTICLAVTPALKAYGIPGRARLFEVEQAVKRVNQARLSEAVRLGKAVPAADQVIPAPGTAKSREGIRPGAGQAKYTFSGASTDSEELKRDPSLKLDFIIAPPQMRRYMAISSSIYNIYLRYIAPEDIHVYSIDEVFIDATGYLKTYRMSAEKLARTMIRDVLAETGITATAGISSNLYLCKVAMDIVAKHIEPDANGVRIAKLDEATYRRELWTHEPLTDFWRVGRGTVRKLKEYGINTMGDIARCSLGGPRDFYNEDLLYRLFGVNAELLIDHGWGYEPTTIADIKAYKPEDNSIGSGQVLQCPYDAEQTRLVVKEMADMLALDLFDKGIVTNQLVLTVGYDIENLSDPERRKKYHGPTHRDFYGREVPKHAHGTANLDYTNSARKLTEAVLELFDRIIDPNLLVRRLNLTACRVLPEKEAEEKIAEKAAGKYEQLDLFTDYAALERDRKEEAARDEKEKNLQRAMLDIKKKFGKNAVLKGMNFEEGATARERNGMVGGHKA